MFEPGEKPDEKSCNILKNWINENNIIVAYVTGRLFFSVLEVVEYYNLPKPDFIVSEVGTCIHRFINNKWEVDQEWSAKLSQVWDPKIILDLEYLMSDFKNASIQPPAGQGEYKLSYYMDDENTAIYWQKELEERINKSKLSVSLVVSKGGDGPVCVDFLPSVASKAKALEFLIKEQNINFENVVFSGDSGNDKSALICGVQGILVGGAEKGLAEELKSNPNVYIAKRKNVLGVLEGLKKFGLGGCK